MTQPPDSGDQQPNDPGATPPSYPGYPGAQPVPPSQQPVPPPGGEFPGSGAYPPPPAGYGPPHPGHPYGPPQQTNQLAMWSMIAGILAGILGLIGACGVIAGPLAIGLSIPARNQVAQSGGFQKGSGMATAGLVLGIIGTALSIMWILLIATGVLDLPNFT